MSPFHVPGGPIVDTTDNAGVISQTQSDLMGRTTRTIQNYVAGGLDSNGLPTETDTAEDVTTDSLYDTSGRLAATVAYDAKGSGNGVQVETTAYLYESKVNPSLQTNEIDPDSTDSPAPVSVVTLSQTDGVATASMTSCGYLPGDWVLIQGATDPRYNGWVQVATVTATSFTYAVPLGTSASDSGTPTAQAMVAWNDATGLTWDSTTDTATVDVANNYTNGEWVSVQGANQSEFDGWFQVENRSASQFSFALPSASVSTATGTIRVRLMADQTSTTYDLEGHTLTSTDQRGVNHAYTYDPATGGVTSDVVTSFGSSGLVDQAVNEIDTAYTDLGQVYEVTSYGTVGGDKTPLNQVEDAYDGWGNLTQEWQALTGTVNPSSTPSVQYGYADSLADAADGNDGANSPGQAADFVRLTDVVYPVAPGLATGRDVFYDYDHGQSAFSDAVDNIMSQLAQITDSTGTLAKYTYLGAGQVASESYPTPAINLDYSAGNFSALDQFGRVVDQIWAQNSNVLDEYRYGYDADGNRVWKENVTADSQSAGLDETYQYDSLNRLISMSRGTISGTTIASPSDTQTWDLDSLGNFTNYTDSANGANDQSRSVDPANEIQTINSSTGTTGYDLAGNMTTTPDPSSPSTALDCTYDAWNRLVQVKSGDTILAQYEYDGTNRQIAEKTAFDTSGKPGAVTYSYYSGQNAVQSRDAEFPRGTTAPPPESAQLQCEYVFSPLGVKTPLLRDSYCNGSIVPDDRLYYLTDANTNVTAVVGYNPDANEGAGEWQVAERYVYDPYGAVTMYDGPAVAGVDWSDPHTVSSVGNTLLYASMVLDLATGLYNDEARWYSTAISTFISRDPAQADENLYRYCENKPTDRTDPSGAVDVEYFRNRGTLLNVDITPVTYFKTELRAGVLLHAAWRRNLSEFMPIQASEVGFVQIFRQWRSTKGTGWAASDAKTDAGPWAVDGGSIPYPYLDKTNKNGWPNVINPALPIPDYGISMIDRPNFSTEKTGAFAHYLVAGGDMFETFVCCVGLGTEGMYTKGYWWGRNPSGRVAVYAAFSWGFSYRIQEDASYDGHYYLDNQSADTSVIPGVTATLPGMLRSRPAPITLRLGPVAGAPSDDELTNLKAALTAQLG